MLRVDTERRFLPRFKIRVWRRRMYQNVAFLGRRRQVDFEAFTYKELGFACGWS
jgi:hypothetical protein